MFHAFKASQISKITRSQAVADKKHLQLFSRYCPLSVLGSRLDHSGSRDVIGHITIGFPIGHFLLAVLWNEAFITDGFQDIQWRMRRNGSRDLKRPPNKIKVIHFSTNRFLIYDFL